MFLQPPLYTLSIYLKELGWNCSLHMSTLCYFIVLCLSCSFVMNTLLLASFNLISIFTKIKRKKKKKKRRRDALECAKRRTKHVLKIDPNHKIANYNLPQKKRAIMLFYFFNLNIQVNFNSAFHQHAHPAMITWTNNTSLQKIIVINQIL